MHHRSRPGCAGRHCIFVNTHTHAHATARTYTHIHAHQHLVHFYFVLLVLLVFSTDIVFCALFWCCFHFCFVYFQRLFLGVATAAGPLPCNPLPRSGAHNGQRGKAWAAGRMDECSVDKVRIHLSLYLSVSLPLSLSLSHGTFLCPFYSFFSSSSSVL